MLQFSREQEVVTIGGVDLGGQPGQYPTVLMGALFYAGDRLVAGSNSSEFDRDGAETVIRKAQDMCREVGVPLVLDLICATLEQARAFVAFGLEVCDLPVLIDGTTPAVRRAGLETALVRGAQDRVIFNAISETTEDRELKSVVECGARNAMVMLVNPRKPTVEGKVRTAREQVMRARSFGFERLFLDLAVLDIVDVGTCAVAMREIKEELGLPCGCSPTHTHRERWVKAPLFSAHEQAAARVSCATMLQCAGADFFMYDIKQTEVIPAMAMIDAQIAYGARTWKVRPHSPAHPLYRVFR